MLIATYIGERFEDESGGYFCTFTNQKTNYGIRWEDVQESLRAGVPVVLMPASAEEITACEAELAIFKAKSGVNNAPSHGEMH